VIAWFNVENPAHIAVTNLKEDAKSLFSVERETRVPGMEIAAEAHRLARACVHIERSYQPLNFSSGRAKLVRGAAAKEFRRQCWAIRGRHGQRSVTKRRWSPIAIALESMIDRRQEQRSLLLP
jgi:hypothetical protein